MTDYTKLIERALDSAKIYGGLHAQATEALEALGKVKTERDALQAENERLNDDCAMHMRVAVKAIDEVVELKAERDQLQADLKAELDGNASLRQQHGAKDNETMRTFIARVVAERDALQAKLDEAQRQEPIYQYMRGDGCWIDQTKASYDYNRKYGASEVRIVYAAPKALERELPLLTAAEKLDVKDALKIAELVVADDFSDTTEHSFITLSRAILSLQKIVTAAAPKALEPLTDAAQETLDEMDSCIRISRAYQRAGESCAEIDPEMVKRWRGVLAIAIAAKPKQGIETQESTR